MNKITLMGRLGKDPELKFLANGTAVCKFSLATSRKWKDKNSGDMQEKVEWHKIVAWGKQGETINQYLHKGDQFLVVGELRYSEWNDNDGNKRTSAEIHVEEFDFVGNKNSKESAGTSSPKPNGRPVSKGPKEEDIPF
jgi:single-strand DNA-binding protein